MIKRNIYLTKSSRKRFKEAVIKRMRERGMTVQDVADELGMAYKTINNFLYDSTKKPSKPLAGKLAEYFDIKYSEWLDFDSVDINNPLLIVGVGIAAITLIYSSLNANAKDVEGHRVDLEKYTIERDIETEVFGEVPATDFRPGYYEEFNIIDPDIPLSEDLQIDIQAICREYDICYELVLAIIENESRFQADAVSKNGKYKGLMQIDTDFHECPNPFDPIENVRAGVKYLYTLFKEYEDTALVLDIYGGYSNAFEDYEKGIVRTATQKILNSAEEYERRHGK